MTRSAWNLMIAVGAVCLAASVSTPTTAQAQAERTIARNDGIFIDGRAFKIVPGTAKADVAASIERLGARPLGPAAIVFRSGESLFIVDKVLLAGTAPARPRASLRADCERDHVRAECERDVRDSTSYSRRVFALNDPSIERQRSSGLADADIERQRPRGLRDPEIERQRPYGLRESEVERQRTYINDPDFAAFKLKKTFDDLWSRSDKNAPAADAANDIADNTAVFIDGNASRVVVGRPGTDTKDQIKSLGARELGPGAIIFRRGDGLYVVDVPLRVASTTGTDLYVTAEREQWKPITIEYVPPKNPEHQKIYDMIKDRRVLETLQQMFSMFRLPVEVDVKTVGCDGVSNAWYERKGKRPTISLCYEYLQELRQGMPEEKMPAAMMSDAICGQLLFAVAHEFGHALIDIFDVPVFGRQEDAADQLATYFILQFGGEQSHQMIRGAAHAYHDYVKDYAQNPKVTLPLTAFSSDHGSPEERFFNLMCLAFGYDSKLFSEVAEMNLLPKSRAKGCDFEYQDLKFAVKELIHPHVDPEKSRKIFMMMWISTSGTRPAAP